MLDFFSYYLIGDNMNLEIEKKTYVEVYQISSLKNHIDKLVNKNINDSKIEGSIEISLTYQDTSFNECFKTINFDFSLELDEINVIDVALGKVMIYVIEGNGVNIEYSLSVLYDSTKKIEIISDVTNESNDSLINTVDTLEELDLKENIKEEYKEKLEKELDKRDEVKIITPATDKSEIDFLKFFDDNFSSYFKIKTLECNSKDELKNISKEYNINLSILEASYDDVRRTVTFKLNE